MMLLMKIALGWFVLAGLVGVLVGKIIRNGGAVIVILALASPVHAQDVTPRIDWTAYSVLVAGNVADLVTTQRVFAQGGSEADPLLGHALPRIIATKAIMVSITALGMRALETHGHPKVASWLGLFSGGVGVAAAVHNGLVLKGSR